VRVSPPAAAAAEAKRKEEERKRKESEDKKKQEEATAAAAAIAAAAAAAGDVHCVCVHVIQTSVCRVTDVCVFHHPQQPRRSIILALPSRLSGGRFCSVFFSRVRAVDLERVSAFRL
jgi:hypothetical protein